MVASPLTLHLPNGAPPQPSQPVGNTSPAIIPTYGQVNLAPLEPLLKLRDGASEASHYIADALRERYSNFKKSEQLTWREIISTGQQIDLFINGKQYLRPHVSNGTWQVIPIKKEDEQSKCVMNVMRFYESNILAKWCSSNPDVIVRPGNDSDKSTQAARGGGVIGDFYERKFYDGDPFVSIREAQLLLRFGTSISRVRYDTGAQGILAIRELVEDKSFELGQGLGMCAECSAMGSAKDFEHPSFPLSPEAMQSGNSLPGLCPKCGSESAMAMPPAFVQKAQSVTGTEQVRTGDIVRDELPLPACRWDLTKRAEDSSWFIYEQRVQLTAIRHLLGNIKLPGGDSSDDFGLNVLESLAFAGQTTTGGGSRSERGKSDLYGDSVTVTEMWLSPDDYAGIKMKGDERTLSGESIPKDSKLTDIFPDGLVAVGLNGMSVVVGLYAENHKSHIVSTHWHTNPLSGAGSGLNDTVEPQKRLNTNDSQLASFWGSSATPAVLYPKGMLTSDKARYLGHPKTNIPVDLSQMPGEIKRLQDAVMQLPPGTPAAGFVEYTYQQLNNFLQLTSHVTDFSGGLPGVRNDTATGAQISASNSNALFTPPFKMKGGQRKRIIELTLKLYPKHFPMVRTFPLEGKFGRQQWAQFSGADVDDDLIIEVVKDSETPRNNFLRQQTIMAFFEVLGGAQGYVMLKEAKPELAAELERIFDVDIQTDNYDEYTGLVRNRLEQMKKGVQAGIVDPMVLCSVQPAQAIDGSQGFQPSQGVLQPPVSPFEPKHDVQRQRWQELLIEDELQDAPMELRGAVELMVQIHHYYYGVQSGALAYQAGETQTAQAAPMAMGQSLLQQSQGDPAAQKQAAQNESDAAQRQHEAEQNTATRQHEATQNEADRQHDLAMTETPYPGQKITESMAYKDAPDDIKRQMEKQAGFQPAKSTKNSSMPAKPTTQNGSKAKK